MALAVGPTLPCPKCRRALEPASWRDERHARCRYCETEAEFRPFPALHATYSVVKAQAVVLSEEATCFFHATNQAAAVCGDCGRLLCPVCSVPHDRTTLCPACIANRRKQQAQAVNSRFLWGGTALSLALLPILLWPFTFVTAPAALTLALIGWRKPQSLVTPGRWRLVVAMLAAATQIALWAAFLVNAALH